MLMLMLMLASVLYREQLLKALEMLPLETEPVSRQRQHDFNVLKHSHMKGTRILVVSIRGINVRFWSHIGVVGKTPIYSAVKVALSVAREEI